jgi:hypothetical protein
MLMDFTQRKKKMQSLYKKQKSLWKFCIFMLQHANENEIFF